MIATPQIAFVRGTTTSTVWVAAADGRHARRIGRGFDPLISPSGRLVAFVRDTSTGWEIAVEPTAAGAGGSAAAGFGAASTVQPVSWSPDSRYLAVAFTGDHASSSGLGVLDVGTSGRLGVGAVAHGFVYGASFAPSGPDRLVYAAAGSQSLGARVDLHTVAADGTGSRRLTRDGRSLYPVWARNGIFFDRERLRGRQNAPAFQVVLRRGSRTTQLTHMRIPALVEGLVPLAASADGNRLLAEYSGQDTSYAWTIQLRPRRVREVRVRGRLVQGGSISRNGRTLLIDEGAFMNPASSGRVETLPFGGGAARRLTWGSSPSWNL